MPLWQRAQGKKLLLVSAAVASPRIIVERHILPLSFNSPTALMLRIRLVLSLLLNGVLTHQVSHDNIHYEHMPIIFQVKDV